MVFIITGHGHFATGLLTSVKLITGMESNFKAIDFEESMSSEDLNKRLKTIIDRTARSESIIIFTDIAGGTPFNQSVLLKKERNNIQVVAGTNLPILVEAALSPKEKSESFLSDILISGKSSIKEYTTKETASKVEIENEEGI